MVLEVNRTIVSCGSQYIVIGATDATYEAARDV